MSTVGNSLEFEKRTLTWKTGLSALGAFLQNVPKVVRASRRDNVDDAFGEKIMLAVTAVNECRYCTREHTKQAAEAGVSDEVVEQILEHDIDRAVGNGELPALRFAQRYAETDGDPGPEARAALEAAYDAETAEDVVANVRNIQFFNLLGNTVDMLRFRLTGRL